MTTPTSNLEKKTGEAAGANRAYTDEEIERTNTARNLVQNQQQIEFALQ